MTLLPYSVGYAPRRAPRLVTMGVNYLSADEVDQAHHLLLRPRRVSVGLNSRSVLSFVPESKEVRDDENLDGFGTFGYSRPLIK